MFSNKLSIVFLLSLTACGSSTSYATKGADGMTISSGFNCSKLSGGLRFTYIGITYSTGDSWTTCEVAGSANQSSSSRLYKYSQGVANTFYCSLTYDSEAPNTSGFWTFSVSGTAKSAVYSDSGATSNGSTVSFASSDCSSF